MPTKRDVLGQLSRDELLAAAYQFDLAVADRRVKDQLVDAVGFSKKAGLADVLAALENFAARIYPTGTLLMAMYGQGVTRDRVAMLGIPATANQACLAIAPSGDVDSWFLFHVFAHVYEQLCALGHEGTQKNLNAKLVGEMSLPIPPVEEQRDITSVVDSLNVCDQVETEFASNLTTLKSALMSVLLTGELRVTPDEAAA